MSKYLSFSLVAVLIVLLAACQPVSVEEAQAQFCADLAEFQTAMAGVEALSPESTVDEAEAALELAADAWNDVQNSAYLVADANYENLEEAYEDLDDAIRAVDEGAAIQDAAASVQDEVANVNAAYDEFYNVQCAD